MTITKPAVEQTIFAWLESPGWVVRHDLDIALGEIADERLCTEIGLSGYAGLTRPTMLGMSSFKSQALSHRSCSSKAFRINRVLI
jgi:hypothetical protein